MDEQDHLMQERDNEGKRQFGNYDLIRRIDTGGMGEVYLAHQRTAFDREVAVKIIRDDLSSDAVARALFPRSGSQLASQLRQTLIAQLSPTLDSQLQELHDTEIGEKQFTDIAESNNPSIDSESSTVTVTLTGQGSVGYVSQITLIFTNPTSLPAASLPTLPAPAITPDTQTPAI
jgi:serine/threonine protein kinase